MRRLQGAPRRWCIGGVLLAVLVMGCGGGTGAPRDTPSAAVPPTPQAGVGATVTAEAAPTASGAQVAPRAVATPAPGSSATPAGGDDRQRAATADKEPSQPLARDDGGGSEPDARASASQEPEGTSKGAAGSTAPAGAVYTWQDGDRTVRVYLATDLIVQDNDDTRDDDEIVARGASESIVRAGSGDERTTTPKPVFRSQAGDLMTLPGGVLIILDDDWDQARVDRFFADNGISASDVEERDWAVNAFFIHTEPGFASLNLANELAALEGVEISSPNWRTQVTTR